MVLVNKAIRNARRLAGPLLLGCGIAATPGIQAVAQTSAPASSTAPVASQAYRDATQPIDLRLQELIDQMTLAEKVSQLVNGAPSIPRLGVPAYNYWSEGLHGIANEGVATVFPQAIGMAATWDPQLVRQEGDVTATEARAKFNAKGAPDQDHGWFNGLTIWSPNINIFRDPRWGRGQETYGEDPYLTGRMGVAYIDGLQGDDPHYLKVAACAKHFAVHSGPEPLRHKFNALPPERDLYETYLPQFEAAVREGHVQQVMSAYNAIDGIPAPADHWLLTDVLRSAWGFDGYVVSDCDAVSDIVDGHHYAPDRATAAVDAVEAGTDLNCGQTYEALLQAAQNHQISETQIDQALRRVLTVRFRLGLFDPPTNPYAQISADQIDSPAHGALALKAAQEAIVLLKNDGTLPLDASKLHTVAVIGSNADNAEMLAGNYNGTPSHPVTILQGIKNRLGSGVNVTYQAGPPLAAEAGQTFGPVAPGYQDAIDAAKSADVVIYVGGISAKLEGEEHKVTETGFLGGDRTRIELPDIQERFVHDLAATGKPVVFVNCSGSAMALAWEAQRLPAIVQAWYPGEDGGTAVAGVLFGDINPSGHLPVTFYASTKDLPSFTSYSMANRTYRYFGGKALWPFGYGLSYTTFKLGQPTLSSASVSPAGTITVSVPVQNTGKRDGDAVVQAYVRNMASDVPQPIHSLCAFQRISVPQGQTVNATLTIDARQLRYWDVATKSYVVRPGAYQLQIGSSSADIASRAELTVAR